MTDKLLLKQMEALPPEQRMLLMKKLQQLKEEKEGGDIISIPRTSDTYRLSFTQYRMWCLDRIQPGNPAYIIPISLRIQGVLDSDILEQVLNEIMKRHESLRSSFQLIKGEPAQQVHNSAKLPWTHYDFVGMEQSERDQKVEQLTREQFRRPFSLAEFPLLRSTLIKLQKEEYLWLIAVHHIIFDGWSVGLLLTEVSSLYESYVKGLTPVLPPVSVHPVDYAEWEQNRLQNNLLADQLSYWKSQMSGSLPLLEIPTDRTRPTRRSSEGKQVTIELPSKLYDTLSSWSMSQSTTLFVTLMAAFQALLYRYSKQEDVIVGFPISGRNLTDIHGVIGAFVNTLPLRCHINEAISFKDFVQQVKNLTTAAFANQDIPFEMLVEAVRPKRNIGYSPLFQVVFNMTKSLPVVQLDGLTFSYEIVDHGTSKFDLNLEVRLREDNCIFCTFEYSTDLFEEDTITVLASHYGRLLQVFADDPYLALGSITFTTE
ncbi:condensation domain-containing protein [Paenibacillus arenosi]|uniref:Condensation domain-containing protein n=1 Tax=Paenibacillus arenosi TaxID=2774142 RepID=A0ABR9AX09_9BACL|nr:condensation domain-containing protein [Paenibacillus arenosi]MBD8498537.1 hypothetical protein [Paenibacillus arenosi]